MADNVNILDALDATKTVATKEVSSAHRQIVVVGSPSGATGFAPVDATNGLAVYYAAAPTVNAAQSGTWNVTNVSGTVSLPTGASTAAKQPALGTAGTPSADVITVQGVTSMTALKVDGSAATQPVSGTVTANQGGSWTVAATQSGTWNVTNISGTISLPTGASTLAEQQTQSTSLGVMDDWDNGASDGASVSGDVAHGTADAGEPVKMGANATASIAGETVVDAGDRTDLYSGVDGVLITRPYCNLEDIVTAAPTPITDGASTSVLAAIGSGIKIYLTSVIISNSSATYVTVDLRDGTGGAVKATIPVPATGGVVHNFPVPLPFSANTAVAADPSAAASTVTVTVIGFKSKV